MQSKRARLDRFIAKRLVINRRDVRPMLASGRILVNGKIASDVEMLVDEFDLVSLDGKILQANSPQYIMLNKPIAYVSATKDSQHPTVVDLLDTKDKSQLHIVGRLDYNSSGLLLLTNDSRWSRQLMHPENKGDKVYHVTLTNPIDPGTIQAFAQGMYFEFEGITTKPAKLEILEETVAQVTLTEGKYHQIKRMFGRFRNPVVSLHRIAIGNLKLDVQLQAGQSRPLTAEEVHSIFSVKKLCNYSENIN